LHADHGVPVLFGTGVDEVTTSAEPDGSRRVTGVRLADGRHLEADAVLVAIGVQPVTGWLEGSGLEIADGVLCDETLHAAPGVVVAGDLARWPDRRYEAELRLEHWENAAEQGGHAAASLLADAGAAPYDHIPYFWSDQYGLKIQLVGLARPGDEVRVVEGSVDERRFVACYGREGRLVAVLSFGRPRLLVRYRRLLEDGTSFEEALRFEP
jgi:3-phenylpropionate/trans-cinnamate dioxygenase ferredoxin reductase subunit